MSPPNDGDGADLILLRHKWGCAWYLLATMANSRTRGDNWARDVVGGAPGELTHAQTRAVDLIVRDLDWSDDVGDYLDQLEDAR